jgi:3-deoxy-D-manno-octulosonate 8-phosphate phosphatase (KDO 8-P phosphatase)
MAELGVSEVHQGVSDKASVLAAIRSRHGLAPAAVAVMGDDLTDLGLMKQAGLGLAPSDAAAEVRRAADWIAREPGGRGAVREAVEMLLKARRAWPPPAK